MHFRNPQGPYNKDMCNMACLNLQRVKITDVKSRLAFTASSDASMEVVIKQHNPLGKGAGDETNDS